MQKIDKLEQLIAEWESKGEAFFTESNIARKHDYKLEAILLDEKYMLIRDLCIEIRLKIIEELLP